MKAYVALGGIYAHYKGDRYLLLSLEILSSNKAMLVYKQIDGETTWRTPLANFFKKIDADTLRFELVHYKTDSFAFYITFDKDSKILNFSEE